MRAATAAQLAREPEGATADFIRWLRGAVAGEARNELRPLDTVDTETACPTSQCCLREEARLATLMRDTERARRATQHYRALRYDPEPPRRAEGNSL
jgi:hypothetical protein